MLNLINIRKYQVLLSIPFVNYCPSLHSVIELSSDEESNDNEVNTMIEKAIGEMLDEKDGSVGDLTENPTAKKQDVSEPTGSDMDERFE